MNSVSIFEPCSQILINLVSVPAVIFCLKFEVDANDDFVVGVSSDSTVCIWDRKTGELKGEVRSTLR